jgi:hypothetical protein
MSLRIQPTELRKLYLASQVFDQLVPSRPLSSVPLSPSRHLPMNNVNGRESYAHHTRYGYGDPPSYSQMEARLFSSKSEAADIMTALELGYKNQAQNAVSFGKNLTRFVSLRCSLDPLSKLKFVEICLQELASRICEEFPHYSQKDQIFFILSLAKKFGVDNNSVRIAAKSLTQHVS